MLSASRSVAGLGLCAFALAVALAVAFFQPASHARAACGDTPGEIEVLFTFVPPVSGDSGFEVSGPAPLTVSATWVPGVLLLAGSTATLNWGDGSSFTPFTGQDCGDGETMFWPPQTHTHTYATPGSYTVTWNVNFIVANFSVPITFVVAQALQAATPTATAAPAPTSTPVLATATAPVPTATPQPPAATPLAVATLAPTNSTPGPTPSPSATPSTSTPTPTLTPSPTAPAAASQASEQTPPPADSSEPERDLPEVLRAMPRLEEISVDSGTVATNLVLAGITLWVLFSSVLLNQVLQENRAEIDERTSRLTRPIRGFARSARRGGTGAGIRAPVLALMAPVFVLLLTGLIYGFLDPAFGFDRSSAVLFLSVVLGVGAVTYVCSGIEALMTRRTFEIAAAVRPYPASLVVAAVSVAITRIIGLQPGAIYGFVASCAIIGTGQIDEHRHGKVTIFPVVTAILFSIAALILIEPLRANDTAASSFLGQVIIGAGIIVFVGGIEGVAFNMIPLSVTDGGKLFRWHRSIWAAVSLVAVFLFWHVLLNRDRQYFDALRQAKSLSVLALFLAYTGLSFGLWAYFHWRPRNVEPFPAGEHVPPL
ncbi:MAG: FGLLP motif-containing membrane protein [Anaerolineaceae bacterium]